MNSFTREEKKLLGTLRGEQFASKPRLIHPLNDVAFGHDVGVSELIWRA